MDLLSFIQEYIRIDTSHPKPNYQMAFDLFSRQAAEDGFTYRTIKLKSGLSMLLISYEGSNPSIPSIVLNHHVDVVPVNEEQWKFQPFEGIVHEDKLYGRGTQDMKSVGACHYFALKRLKDAGLRPDRSIHLAMLPHEEVGGFAGAGFFVASDEFKELNVGYVLDEGLPSGSTESLLLKVSERKPMQMSITSVGEMAHGSRLCSNNAIHELVLFLAKVAQFQKEQKTKDGPLGLLLSMNITSFQAGVIKNGSVALNIVPSDATATLDVRVSPTMNKSEALKMIHEMMQEFPGIAYEIKTQAGERDFNQDYKDDFYYSLKRTIEKYDLEAVDYYAEESSDMRFYWEKGIAGFGLSPFTIEENLHGIDEAVKISDLTLGCDIFYSFIKDFCSQNN